MEFTDRVGAEAALQLLLTQPLEQVMVSKPAASFIQGDYKQMGLFQPVDELTPRGLVRGIRGLGARMVQHVAKFHAETVQDGCFQ